MAQETRRSGKIDTPGQRPALPRAEFADTPELTFTSRGDPDARLVQLVRLLARQAARDHYEAQMRSQGKSAS